MPPKLPPAKSKSQPTPKVGTIGQTYLAGKADVAIPMTLRTSSKAQAALESLTNTGTPAALQPPTTAGSEPAQKITVYPGIPSANGGLTSTLEFAQNAIDFVNAGGVQTPGMALDAYLTKIVKQNEDLARRVKALEAALLDISRQIAKQAVSK